MPPPGYVFRDGLPIPDSDLDQSSPSHGQQSKEPSAATPTAAPASDGQSQQSRDTSKISSTLDFSDKPTDSRALAHASTEQEELGAVQQGHEEGEVRDMGWQTKRPDDSLVGGLSNDDLWTLIRRFDKQMYHVKVTEGPLLGGLDLEIADEDEFSPDKLRANVERLYMTVIIGIMAFGSTLPA